jgi:hypothetical protein
MGKASSSKKVARAARAGSTHKGPERRAVGFPLAIALTIVLGTSLVLFSRENRSETIAPTRDDHWHAAYGIWNCDHFEPALTDIAGDPDGIHSHADGIIHIHPFNSGATGTRATLGKFFDTEGVTATDDKITLPSGTVLDESAGCGGDEAELVVARWPADDPGAEPELSDDDFDDIRLREDREVFTIGLVKKGDTPPRPESVPTLDNLSDVSPLEAGSTTIPSEPAPTSTPVEDGATTTTPPDGATTTAPPDGATTTAPGDGATTTTTG